MGDDGGVAELAGEAVMSVDDLSVDDDTRTDTGAEGDHDEILHTAGGAVGHLAHSGGVGVVGEADREAAELLGERGGELHGFLGRPCEVGCIGHLAGIIVAVGGADAHATDLAFLAGLLDDGLDCSGQGIEECVGVIAVSVGADDGLCQDGTTGVHNAELGGLTSYVDTNDVLFLFNVFHDMVIVLLRL